jgi:hypothetical protein
MEQQEEESAFEMGKRPSRQRRHLPTSVTSAVTSRSTDDRKNIPLLKMSFREKIDLDDEEEEEQEEEEEEEEEEAEDFGTSTGYSYTRLSNNNSNNRRKKRTSLSKNKYHSNNNNEIKRKAQQFVNNSTIKCSKKKQIIWTISTLWILFIFYRIFISFKKEDYGNLNIFHFISNVILKQDFNR